MWWFLVFLGGLIALAGTVIIGLGAGIYVTTVGNTLITAGAVAASGGFVIITMGLVLRQLERLSRRVESSLSAIEAASGSRTEAAGESPAPVAPVAAGSSAITPTPVAPRPRNGLPHMTAEDLLPPSGETGEAEEAAPAPAASGEPAPERPAPRLRPPVISTPPRAERAEERPFEEAAPDPMVEARRARLERRPEPEPRSAGPRSRYEPGAPRPAPAPRPQAAPAPIAPRRGEGEEPRILKSGIVGGMAYTLYSDGSIQADLPDGVVRFASLQELRDHVSQAQQNR